MSVRFLRVIALIVVVMAASVGAVMRVARAQPQVPSLAYREQLTNGRQAIALYDPISDAHVRVGYATQITFIGWTADGAIGLKPTIQDDWTTFDPATGWATYTGESSPSFPIMDNPYVPQGQHLELRGTQEGWDVYRVDSETYYEEVVAPLRSLDAYPRVIWAPDEQHLLHFETTLAQFLLRHVDLQTDTAQVIYRYPFGEISSTLFSEDKRWLALRVKSTVRSDLHIVVIDLNTGEKYTVARNRPRVHLIGFQPGV
ncbi:MAG: hypothetical protein AAFV33_17530 [Chloroflexota bacterium]